MDLFQNPHQGQPVRMAGEPISQAKAAIVMVHGRGAWAEDILTLTDHLANPGLLLSPLKVPGIPGIPKGSSLQFPAMNPGFPPPWPS